MRSYAVLLALLPLCFAAPNVRLNGEAVDEGLLSGRSCLLECQIDVHGQFNLSTNSRPRDFLKYCEFSGKLSECFDECPESPASPLTKQDDQTNAQICAKDWDQAKFKEFLDAQKRMSERWAYQTMSSCARPKFDASRMFEKCRHRPACFSLFLDCFFGEALTAVKDGYDMLVVVSIVVPLKLQYAQKIGGGVWTEDVVNECSVLFAPFETDHMDPSSLPAASCLLYCQDVIPAKYPDIPQSVQRPDKALYCEYTRAFEDCLGKCQESPITPVIKQSADVNARVCALDFGEEQLTAFFAGQKELLHAWFTNVESCTADIPRRERPDLIEFYEKCSVYLDCFFGEAFDAVKDDFDELVVAALSSQFKLQYAHLVGRGEWTKAVADECPVVFKPFEARNASAAVGNTF